MPRPLPRNLRSPRPGAAAAPGPGAPPARPIPSPTPRPTGQPPVTAEPATVPATGPATEPARPAGGRLGWLGRLGRLRLPAQGRPARSAPGGRSPWLLTAVLVVAVLAAGTLTGWLYALHRHDQQSTAAASQALAAAQADAKLLLSYNYQRIDADIAAAQKVTTGSFRAEYTKTATTAVKPLALQNKVVVIADVRAAAVQSASPNQVVVLLFVNQATTSTKITGQKIDQNRVRMTMVKQGGTWLISAVAAL